MTEQDNLVSAKQLPDFFGVRDVSPALDAASRTHQHSRPIQSGADTPHSKESSHVDSRSRSFGRCRVVARVVQRRVRLREFHKIVTANADRCGWRGCHEGVYVAVIVPRDEPCESEGVGKHSARHAER